MGRAMIRLGDRTSHGGTVIEGMLDLIVDGKPVACVGHKVHCPKCRGTHPIIEGAITTNYLGVGGVALDGMKTACGAVLIASQNTTTVEYGSENRAGSTAKSGSGAAAAMQQNVATSNAADKDETNYDRFFEVISERTGKPLVGYPYKIELASGIELEGVTSEDGHTELVSSSEVETATLHVFDYIPKVQVA